VLAGCCGRVKESRMDPKYAYVYVQQNRHNIRDILCNVNIDVDISANTSSSEDTSISGDHASNEDKVPSLQFIVTLSPENELSCINRILSIETQIRLHLRNGR